MAKRRTFVGSSHTETWKQGFKYLILQFLSLFLSVTSLSFSSSETENGVCNNPCDSWTGTCKPPSNLFCVLNHFPLSSKSLTLLVTVQKEKFFLKCQEWWRQTKKFLLKMRNRMKTEQKEKFDEISLSWCLLNLKMFQIEMRRISYGANCTESGMALLKMKWNIKQFLNMRWGSRKEG